MFEFFIIFLFIISSLSTYGAVVMIGKRIDYLRSEIKDVELKFKKELHEIVTYLNTQGDKKELVQAYNKLAHRLEHLEKVTLKVKADV